MAAQGEGQAVGELQAGLGLGPKGGQWQPVAATAGQAGQQAGPQQR